MVDLAGSEDLRRTKASGHQKTEAQHINTSLHSTVMVIRALSEKQSYVPYRNSKLTMLLQDSLGGSALCVMIANVSPSNLDVDNTRSTLHTAHSAKNIKNRIKKNKIAGEDSKLAALEAEILRLKILADQQADALSHTGKEDSVLAAARMKELSSYLLIPRSVHKAAKMWRRQTDRGFAGGAAAEEANRKNEELQKKMNNLQAHEGELEAEQKRLSATLRQSEADLESAEQKRQAEHAQLEAAKRQLEEEEEEMERLKKEKERQVGPPCLSCAFLELPPRGVGGRA